MLHDFSGEDVMCVFEFQQALLSLVLSQILENLP